MGNFLKNTVLSLTLVFLTASAASADIKLYKLFKNNMVLQRDTVVPIWGWADPGEEITVAFAGQVLKTKAVKSGKWMVKLQPMKASSKGQTMIVTGKKMAGIKNVLVGDIWVCAGQANMERQVRHTHGYAEVMKKPDSKGIRYFEVERNYSTWPVKFARKGKMSWKKCERKNVPYFSAVAYYFAKEIYKETKVPIGIIASHWSNVKIAPWIPVEG
ncbi:MAG: sialate O-acetylesterase, partial [Planctomycetota bacterium]